MSQVGLMSVASELIAPLLGLLNILNRLD